MDNEQLQHWVDRLDTDLVRYFAAKDLSCNPLDRAMEYTLLAGGKRLRPLLTLIACHQLGGDIEEARPFSLAAELLHTYSLIHDDLPCMDDDAMRRGKPTNHIVFGEANAVLAGDALHSEAFYLLAASPHGNLSAQRRILIIREFCEAAGRRGMVAGQVMDLDQTGKPIDLAEGGLARLTLLHRRKTGGLLRFCVRLGGHLAAADEQQMDSLSRFADTLGLMFQVVDDLLDEEGSSEVLGKTAGKDRDQGKATFPKLMGLAQTHAFADNLLTQSLAALEDLHPPGGLLAEIAHYVRRREY